MQGALPLHGLADHGNARKSKKWLLSVLALVAVIAGSTGAFLVVRRQPADGNVSAAAASVYPQLREIASTVTTSGTVRLRTGAQVRVGSQVSGIVRKLNVTVGTHIKRGDVIAEIDPRPLEARVEQAQTQLAMDEVSLGKAQRDLIRGQQLFAEGLSPLQQKEDLEWQVKGAQAKFDKSTSDLAAAEVDLSYAVIHAPISGTVASVSTQEGETVAASFAAPTFVTIIEDNALELIAMVDETDIANVRPRDPVSFTVEAYPSRELSAVVQRIDPIATIISGVVNYPVMASIRRDAELLKPDMTANITITTAEHKALLVPNSAIQREGDQRFVLVLKNGKTEKRVVAIGTRDSGFTEITKGVTASDTVVISAPPEAEKKG